LDSLTKDQAAQELMGLRAWQEKGLIWEIESQGAGAADGNRTHAAALQEKLN
jgi:hypothetical protein